MRRSLQTPSSAVVAAILIVAGCESSAPRSAPAADRDTKAKPSTAWRGVATLDGAPLDARFLGAVVRRDGLVTPCNVSLPRVHRGRFAIRVYRASASAGCGGRGTAVLFWTFAHSTKIYATSAIPWPKSPSGPAVTVAFSSTQPQGAAPAVTELDGHVLGPDGTSVRTGRVEARIDGTVCGVASIRDSRDFVGYILSIVGPDAIPACRAGAVATLTVDRVAARETAINSPDQTRDLDLRLEGAPQVPSNPAPTTLGALR